MKFFVFVLSKHPTMALHVNHNSDKESESESDPKIELESRVGPESKPRRC